VCPDVLNETFKDEMELTNGNLEKWESLNTACDTSVTFIWSFVVAIFCIGGMMGGSVVGLVSSRLGRKGGLLLNNILVVISAVLMGAAKAAGSYHMLILGRLIIGINAGLNAGLAPMYLAEISPTSLRGALGTVYQLIITMSILLSQVLGMGSLLGTPEGWPWLLAVTAVPAIFQIATLPFCPESPKYLLLDKDDEHGAEEALQWLRGTIEVHDEMDEMKQEQESMKLVPKVTLKEMLVNSSLRKPLIIAMMMMLAQQLSGINCAIFYSTSIFEKAGLGGCISAIFCTLF
jgi:SP family facilitated glucose transporter-like MFS transporter 1